MGYAEEQEDETLTEAEQRKDKRGHSYCVEPGQGRVSCSQPQGGHEPDDSDSYEDEEDPDSEPEDELDDEPEEEEPEEEYEWDGVINQGEVEEGIVEDDIRPYVQYDRDGEPIEYVVSLQRGTFRDDVGEDHKVYRWVAYDTDGNPEAAGKWKDDYMEAMSEGKDYAIDNHEEENKVESGIDDFLDKAGEPEKRKVSLTTNKQARSDAQIFVANSVDEQVSDKVVAAIFGTEAGSGYDELSSTIGMPDDAEVNVVAAGPYDSLYADDLPKKGVGVRVSVEHPMIEKCSRFVGVDEDGKRFILNEILKLKKEHQGNGAGADIFARQVEVASEEGIDYIQTHAAGGPGQSMNGYYTWPRFGYDMDLDDPSIPAADRPVFEKAAELFGAKTILDVMSTQEGRDWWKANGTDLYNARFDLTPGSRSMQVLSDYLAERERKKQ